MQHGPKSTKVSKAYLQTCIKHYILNIQLDLAVMVKTMLICFKSNKKYIYIYIYLYILGQY